MVIDLLDADGQVVSNFKMRSMRLWRPFCWEWPGLMRSMPMPMPTCLWNEISLLSQEGQRK